MNHNVPEREEYEFVYNHLEAIYIRDDINISVANIDSLPALNYHIYLNVTGDVINATYMDEDSFNGVLTANHNFQIELEKSDYNVETTTAANVHPGMLPEDMQWGAAGNLSLKDGLVGVISKALFNQFDQRAAIRNDMLVEGDLYDNVNNELETIFTNNVYQDRIFQRYVASGRYAEDDLNDLNAAVQYNLNDSVFRFGMVFYGLASEHDDNSLENVTNILDGVGYHPNGINMQDEVNFVTNTPAYRFNVLFQIFQNSSL